MSCSPTCTRSGPPVEADAGADPQAVRGAEGQADGAGGGAGDRLGGHHAVVALDLDEVADGHVHAAHQQVQAAQLGQPSGALGAGGLADPRHQGVVQQRGHRPSTSRTRARAPATSESITAVLGLHHGVAGGRRRASATTRGRPVAERRSGRGRRGPRGAAARRAASSTGTATSARRRASAPGSTASSSSRPRTAVASSRARSTALVGQLGVQLHGWSPRSGATAAARGRTRPPAGAPRHGGRPPRTARACSSRAAGAAGQRRALALGPAGRVALGAGRVRVRSATPRRVSSVAASPEHAACRRTGSRRRRAARCGVRGADRADREVAQHDGAQTTNSSSLPLRSTIWPAAPRADG